MHCDAVKQIFLLTLLFCWNCCLLFSDIVDCWTPEPTCGTKSWARSKGGGRKKKSGRVSIINFKGPRVMVWIFWGWSSLKHEWINPAWFVFRRQPTPPAQEPQPEPEREPEEANQEEDTGDLRNKVQKLEEDVQQVSYYTLFFSLTLFYSETKTIPAAFIYTIINCIDEFFNYRLLPK